MSARAPLVILPRELGQVPPPLQLVGHKARGLAQLLALKARVPRFGILTSEAFAAHMGQDEIKTVIEGARANGFEDDAARISHGEAIVRAVLRFPLPISVRIGVHELVSAFAEEDVLAVRASVVGEPLEAAVVTGALDSALGVRGKEPLEDAILRIMALAFHPRTLGLREAAGLPPVGCRLAVVVQRMVLSESSGVCVSLERPRHALVRGCWGLAGGIGGKLGNARIPSDVVRVARPAIPTEGIADDAQVDIEVATKLDALRLDETSKSGVATRMMAVPEHQRRECCVSAVQSRMVAREALRLEASFGKPQVISWSFAGRLLHVLDVEPVLIPVARVESERARTWDDRLLPAGLLQSTGPLTFSVWQRAAARGVERAGRILGVKGVILEDTRPQMPRLLGHVNGRMYGNVEVLTALLDLLPFADKVRAALAAATGQTELVPRKAPPPGFWQKQRQKLDEGRWPGHLERISQTAVVEAERLRADVDGMLERVRALRPAALDPDSLMDTFDELEDALSKIVAALALAGLAAMLYREELDAAVEECALKDDPDVIAELLGGEVPGDLVELPRRLFGLVELVRRRRPLLRLLRAEADRLDALAARLFAPPRPGGDGDGGDGAAALSDDERRLAEELRALTRTPAAVCTGELTLEGARIWEQPHVLLAMVLRLVDTSARVDTVEQLARRAAGARKKAEYALELAEPGMRGGVRKRLTASLEGVRRHGRDVALMWIPAELVVDRLRTVALALGERLFEHGLIDQPRDIFHLTTPDVAGLVRGTGVDQDGRPLVVARKRQAAGRTGDAARPAPPSPRRVETRGVVATSPTVDDEAAITSPGDIGALAGRALAAGVVRDIATLLDDGNAPFAPTDAQRPSALARSALEGVVMVRVPRALDLPLLLVAKAVVAERGSVWGPASYALRALGVPAVVDAADALATFVEGEPLAVDGARGIVGRAAKGPDVNPHVVAGVDPHIFAREAVLSDPRARPRATAPAQPSSDLDGPPSVLRADGPPSVLRADGPPVVRPPADFDDDFVVVPPRDMHSERSNVHELDTDDDDDEDNLERTDIDDKP